MILKKICLTVWVVLMSVLMSFASLSTVETFDEKTLKTQNFGPLVYSVKTPMGLYYSYKGKDFFIGGTEVRNPSNASIYILEGETGHIVMEREIPFCEAIWAFCDTPKELFFATIHGSTGVGSSLFRVSKATHEVEKLYTFEEQMVYTMTYDSKGALYIGTSHDANLYQYKINSNDMTKLNVDKISDQDVIRSMVYQNGICYLGIGTKADLIAFDLQKKKVSSILPNAHKSESFVYDIKIVDDKIGLLLSPSMKLLLYDPISKKMMDWKLEKWEKNDDLFQNTLYNFAGLQVVGFRDSKAYKRFPNEQMISSKILKDKIVGIVPSGIYKVVDRENNQLMQSDLSLSLNKTWEQPIEFIAENGFLYFPGRRFKVYKQNQLLGIGIVDSEPQASAISSKGVYTANYTQAQIWFYPRHVLNTLGLKGENLSQEKFLIADIGQGQLRPYMMAVSKNEKYLATVSGPQYGQYGGALTIYDIKNGQKQYTHRHIVKNHGLISLEMDDKDENLVWLGSYIWGEKTLKPIEDEAKLIKYDIKNEKVIFAVTPIKDAPSIRSIIKLNDAVYCLVNNELFKIDPLTGKNISRTYNIKINEICKVGSSIVGISNSELFFIDKHKMVVSKKYSGYTLLNNLRFDQLLNEIYVFDGYDLLKFSSNP